MDRDAVIREIAYDLWQKEGRPEGRQEEFWFQAEVIYQRQEAPSGRALNRQTETKTSTDGAAVRKRPPSSGTANRSADGKPASARARKTTPTSDKPATPRPRPSRPPKP